jgi:zinc protease
LGAVDFAAAVEERAGSMTPWISRSLHGFGGTWMGDEFRTAMDLLGLCMREPRFDDSEVGRVKADLLEAIRLQDDDPGALAHDLAVQALFSGHPWGRPELGTPAGVGGVTPRKLRSFHKRVICGSNLVLGLAGAVDEDVALTHVERNLGDLPLGAPWEVIPPDFPDSFVRRQTRHLPRAQGHLVVAFPMGGVADPHAPTQRVLSALLGGATSGAGLLFDELRERLGLAYDVGAHAEMSKGAGALFCTVAADPERFGEAEAALWSVLERLAQGKVPDADVVRVRKALVDGAVLSMQRASSSARRLAVMEIFGMDAHSYRAHMRAPGKVAVEDVHALASRVLRSDRHVSVAVRPHPAPQG